MKKNSIAKNYIYNLIYQMLTIFLPLITTPYLSRILGAKQIGIYGYTTSILAYFILWKYYEEKLKQLLKGSVDLINLIPQEIKNIIAEKLNE